MMGVAGHVLTLNSELPYPLVKMLQRGLSGISFHLQYGGIPPKK